MNPPLMSAPMEQIVKELEETMQCNCDLDNWQPEQTTGHSCVCRIHKIAMARQRESR